MTKSYVCFRFKVLEVMRFKGHDLVSCELTDFFIIMSNFLMFSHNDLVSHYEMFSHY